MCIRDRYKSDHRVRLELILCIWPPSERQHQHQLPDTLRSGERLVHLVLPEQGSHISGWEHAVHSVRDWRPREWGVVCFATAELFRVMKPLVEGMERSGMSIEPPQCLHGPEPVSYTHLTLPTIYSV
eukprot:TRINITY_DN4471_c0_g1_i1.p1 TRINITY_DN4471_c0_g1~~TRINITY_DN4471_c0_g1_i1.p1  ORF type:complete len:127 (+),score=28.62 TRINITY_DN4471_c0_g1_i1:113-493(+)